MSTPVIIPSDSMTKMPEGPIAHINANDLQEIKVKLEPRSVQDLTSSGERLFIMHYIRPFVGHDFIPFFWGGTLIEARRAADRYCAEMGFKHKRTEPGVLDLKTFFEGLKK